MIILIDRHTHECPSVTFFFYFGHSRHTRVLLLFFLFWTFNLGTLAGHTSVTVFILFWTPITHTSAVVFFAFWTFMLGTLATHTSDRVLHFFTFGPSHLTFGHSHLSPHTFGHFRLTHECPSVTFWGGHCHHND